MQRNEYIEQFVTIMIAGEEKIIEHSKVIELINELKVSNKLLSDEVYTPTEIGNRLSSPLSAKKVNYLLQQMGYQIKVNNKWRFTKEGETFAVCKLRVFTIKENGTYGIEYDLLWKADIINELEKILKVQRGEVA